MSFNRYFQKELHSLHELGKDFSERNPALAPFLGLSGNDPDVERIFEGFSFLSGRIRQKIDDEFPEITHSLFNLLWPSYLRSIPAGSIVACRPDTDTPFSVVIPSGTLVESVPVEGTRCKFRTVYAAEVHPLRISAMRIIESNDTVGIALHFTVLNGLLHDIPLRRLRFYLAGESVIAHTLYFTLLNQVREVRVVLRDAKGDERVTACLNSTHLRPVGFLEEEELYPFPANTFPGYRILQEYFCFPEKFLFVELSGLEQGINPAAIQNFQDSNSFEIQFVLKELPELFESFRVENWQLFCTPAVNLFSMNACPLALQQRQTEYRIVPEPRLPYHYSVYNVDAVASCDLGSVPKRRYLPFESFEHEAGKDTSTAYYRLRARPSPKDGSLESYISFVQSDTSAQLPIEETISLDITCTNRLLPEKLRLGDIHINTDKGLTGVKFSNITPVIPAFNPPLEGNMLWRLLSNMSLNYIALMDIHALRATLGAHNFRALHDKTSAKILKKTMKSMIGISSEDTDSTYKGLPIRGAQTRLILAQKGFSCEGAMYLFGSVLNEFFALCATVNSFHQFVVEEASRKEEYRWAARLGKTLSI